MRRFFSKGVNTVLAECTNPAESRQRETKRYKEATGLPLYEGGGLPLLLRTSAIPPYTIPPSAPTTSYRTAIPENWRAALSRRVIRVFRRVMAVANFSALPRRAQLILRVQLRG